MIKDDKTEREEPAGSPPAEITEDGAEAPAPADTAEEEKCNMFVRFFKHWGGVLAAAGCLLLIAAMAVLAFILGGEIYDKVAMFWILAFIAEFAYYLLMNRSKKTMTVMIVTAVCAVGFVVLYGLELGGILP